jgi:putative membrane protein
MTDFEYMAALVAGSNWDHGGAWWFPFAVLWVAVLGAVIWFVARNIGRRELSGSERAREILAERYASGELTGEEYRERLDQLREV